MDEGPGRRDVQKYLLTLPSSQVERNRRSNFGPPRLFLFHFFLLRFIGRAQLRDDPPLLVILRCAWLRTFRYICIFQFFFFFSPNIYGYFFPYLFTDFKKGTFIYCYFSNEIIKVKLMLSFLAMGTFFFRSLRRLTSIIRPH